MKWIIVILFSGSIYVLADDDFKVIQPKKKMVNTLKHFSVRENATRRSKTEMELVLDKIQAQGERVDAALGRFQQKSGVWDFTNEFDF
ncbi:MAG: hypothetical protein K2Q18_13955, partial [Bdellovibrionales bacterium]|nr:hypothetical protein [Bdellovibrionales bacterium]